MRCNAKGPQRNSPRLRIPLPCNTVNSCFFDKHFARLVGAGLALPPFHSTEKLQGQGKPSPYETRKMFAKKTRIYGIAMQTCGVELCATCVFSLNSVPL